jgi:OOP family OmpA-OmpF porin
MKKTFLSAALAAALVAPSAFADNHGNFYVGGAVGKTEVDYVEFAGVTVTDDSDTSWKLFAGYNFNENFAVEFAYQDLGDNSFEYLNVPATADGEAYSLALLAKLPMGEQAEAYAKLGYARVDAEVSAGGLTLGADDSDVLYGLGVSYSVTETVDLRLEWERMDFDDEIDTYSLGVSYNF